MQLLYHAGETLYSAKARLVEPTQVDLSPQDVRDLLNLPHVQRVLILRNEPGLTLDSWNFGTGEIPIRVDDRLKPGEYSVHYTVPEPVIAMTVTQKRDGGIEVTTP